MKAVLLVSALAASSVAATLNAQVTPAKPDSTCTTHPDGRVECRIERRLCRRRLAPPQKGLPDGFGDGKARGTRPRASSHGNPA